MEQISSTLKQKIKGKKGGLVRGSSLMTTRPLAPSNIQDLRIGEPNSGKSPKVGKGKLKTSFNIFERKSDKASDIFRGDDKSSVIKENNSFEVIEEAAAEDQSPEIREMKGLRLEFNKSIEQ